MSGPNDEAIEFYGRADHFCAAEQEAGLSTAGGMDVSEAKRLKQLEDENAKLKRSWLMRCSTVRRGRTL